MKMIDANYYQCPYCKSESIECDEHYFDGSVVNCHMSCVDCEEQWDECYEMKARYTKEGNTLQVFPTYENKILKELN